MGIPSVDLNNVNFDDVNFDGDDPEIIIHVRPVAWCNRFKQRKAFKKDISKELLPIAWWDGFCQKMKRKK